MVVRRGPTADATATLVWIHGLGESSVSFEPVIARLPSFAHVLVDLPGYGRSPWPSAAPSLGDLAETLSRWLAADPRVVLVGHSMGGVLATLVAEQTHARGVIDVDGNLSRGDCTFSAAAAAYSLADFVSHGFAELRASVYAQGATRSALRGYHAAMCFSAPHVFHHHALELVELSAGGTLSQRLAALAVPKLFVAGVPDGICAASRALLDRHGIPWLGIEPAGHWVYLDQPGRFCAAVEAFVADLASPVSPDAFA
jgi:pimeloyl-ACP methyl ester carboxylesterase